MSISVGVIGAGAAGLSILRHLTARTVQSGSRPVFEAVAFEQTSHVGGTWVYTEDIGTHKDGLPVHSSMYYGLSTNLPKETMMFPDFPFKKEYKSFLTRTQVHEYLEEYADHFNLRKYIQFRTKVTNVAPIQATQQNSDTAPPESDAPRPASDTSAPLATTPHRWQVDVECVDTQKTRSYVFDAVVVCNGHYSVPLVPDIPGAATFQGTVLHSHDYRHAEQYTDKRVVLLGAASSGQDISLELAKYAKQVHLCHRKPSLTCPLPPNVSQHTGITRVTQRGVELEDGSSIGDVDVIMWCTGYKYTYPFLDKSCHPDITDEYITPLYKHIIHCTYPTLSFIGVPKIVVPFPQFDCQSRFICASLDGTMPLPSSAAMLADSQADYAQRQSWGYPDRHMHHLSDLQWEYNDDLARLAGFTPLPKLHRLIYNATHDERTKSLITYKTINFNVTGDETYEVIK